MKNTYNEKIKYMPAIAVMIIAFVGASFLFHWIGRLNESTTGHIYLVSIHDTQYRAFFEAEAVNGNPPAIKQGDRTVMIHCDQAVALAVPIIGEPFDVSIPKSCARIIGEQKHFPAIAEKHVSFFKRN